MQCVLFGSGCYHKIPPTAWLKHQAFVSAVLKAGKSNIKVPKDRLQVRTLFLACRGHLLSEREESSSLRLSSYKNTNPITESHPCDLTYLHLPKAPRLNTPHWELGLKHMYWGGDTKIQAITGC